MTSVQATLWQKIQAFSFDPPEATYPFVDRLIKENAWPPEFANRAIEEYRRFAFLAVAAGHPVSPSDAVDQVWHLHLLYTRSYWERFCGDVLGRPLHHEPSTGASGEPAKFDEWYARTLASYRQFFGEPPADLWPEGFAKLTDGRRFCRVDLSDHWLLPRARVLRVAQAVAAVGLLILLVMLVGGCQTAGGRTEYNPLEFRGPDFLAFFALAFGVAAITALLIRLAAKESAGAEQGPGLRTVAPPDAYEAAYLAGGPERVVAAGVASLYQRGLLEASTSGFRRSPDGAVPPGVKLHPVEQELWDVAREDGGRLSVATLRRRTRDIVERCGEPLKRAGWVIGDDRANTARALSMLVMFAVPAFGVIKIFVGLSRGRPVLLLVIGCVVSAIAAWVIGRRRPLRTRRGDDALQNLRRLRQVGEAAPNAAAELIAMAVALGGVGALSGGAWMPLRRAMQPPTGEGGWDWSGGTYGCGTSSSCGGSGGGCGGGGCGGCGGCGG